MGEEEDTIKGKEECEQEMMLDDKVDRKKGREVIKEEFIQETISPAKVFMCREKKAKEEEEDDDDEVEVIESEDEIIEEVMDVDNVEEVLIDDDDDDDDDREFDMKREEKGK